MRQGGLKVYTTIDPELQEAGRDAIGNHLYYSSDPSAAVVSIDPSTGFVRAMASSGGYGGSQFNLAAQGHRQPGSAFKTFALTDAVRRGIDPDTTYYTSQPLDIDDPEYGHWDVSTYSDSYAGSVNLHSATLASDNTVYAQLALDLGPDSIADTAKDMGIETKLDGLPGRDARRPAPRRLAARDHQRLRDARLGRSPQQADRDPQGEVPRRPGRRDRRARPQPRVRGRRRLRGHRDPRGQRRRRHRHRGRHGLRRRGRQDRHHGRLQRRDVRRLHAPPRHRRLGRLPRRPPVDELGRTGSASPAEPSRR